MKKFILITLIIFTLPSCTYRKYGAQNCFLENDCQVIAYTERICLNSLLCPKKVTEDGVTYFARHDRSRNPLHGTIGGIGTSPEKCFTNDGHTVTETLCLTPKD